jgi:hypothetical protein
MVTNDDQKVAKVAQKFYCILCDHKCIKKSNFEKHLSTEKHKKRLLDDQIMTNDDQKVAKVAQALFTCECGRKYKYKQGLSVHKKKCNFILDEQSDTSNNQLTISNDVIMKLLNDNQELKNIIFKQQEQISELIPKVGNTNNTINNNQKFNINVFLNEQCKDAINLSDFIKSLHVTLEQLDFTNKNGLADGISKTIIDNMSKLSIYERPMHCTDVKRETLYIKEDNAWSKDKAKEKVKSVIKKTSSKNFNALMDWKTLNPDFMKSEDKTDYFTKTISTIGKSTDSINEKIIKKLCKETYVKDSV